MQVPTYLFFTLDELIQIMASWGSLLNVALTLKSHHNIALYLNTCPLIKTNSLQCTDQPPSPLIVDLLWALLAHIHSSS